MKVQAVEFGDAFFKELAKRVVNVAKEATKADWMEYEVQPGKFIYIMVCDKETIDNVSKVLNYLYGEGKELSHE